MKSEGADFRQPFASFRGIEDSSLHTFPRAFCKRPFRTAEYAGTAEIAAARLDRLATLA